MSQQENKKVIKVGVIGAGGRMGRMLIEATQDNPKTTLSAAIERQGSSLVGADARSCGYRAFRDTDCR